MQMGTIHNGNDLETVAAAKHWLFQELHGWWMKYDKCGRPSSSACHLLMVATAQWMLSRRMLTHQMLMLDLPGEIRCSACRRQILTAAADRGRFKPLELLDEFLHPLPLPVI